MVNEADIAGEKESINQNASLPRPPEPRAAPGHHPRGSPGERLQCHDRDQAGQRDQGVRCHWPGVGAQQEVGQRGRERDWPGRYNRVARVLAALLEPICRSSSATTTQPRRAYPKSESLFYSFMSKTDPHLARALHINQRRAHYRASG